MEIMKQQPKLTLHLNYFPILNCFSAAIESSVDVTVMTGDVINKTTVTVHQLIPTGKKDAQCVLRCAVWPSFAKKKHLFLNWCLWP